MKKIYIELNQLIRYLKHLVSSVKKMFVDILVLRLLVGLWIELVHVLIGTLAPWQVYIGQVPSVLSIAARF